MVVKNSPVLQVYVKSLTLRLVNAIVLIPILAYLLTLVFAGIVGSEVLEGSMIEEYFYCIALLTLILIIKEIRYVITISRRQKEI